MNGSGCGRWLTIGIYLCGKERSEQILRTGWADPVHPKQHIYSKTSGFWPRVRARALRAPVFLGLLTCQTGRCAPPPPIAASLLLIYPQKLSLRPLGVYLSIGQSCTLLSYIASYWATLHPPDVHPNELRCTLLSYAVPLRYAAFNWVMLHPI